MTKARSNDAAAQQQCPCDSGRLFIHCCEPYLVGKILPQTAESLMRSRYSAYATQTADYLLNSWHPSTRPAQFDFEQPPLQWLGLRICRTNAGTADDNQGLVEFIARCKHHGKAFRLHERSRFIKENGQWFYLDGEQLE